MAEVQTERSFYDCFDIDDRESCNRAVRHGAYAACFLAVVMRAPRT